MLYSYLVKFKTSWSILPKLYLPGILFRVNFWSCVCSIRMYLKKWKFYLKQKFKW